MILTLKRPSTDAIGIIKTALKKFMFHDWLVVTCVPIKGLEFFGSVASSDRKHLRTIVKLDSGAYFNDFSMIYRVAKCCNTIKVIDSVDNYNPRKNSHRFPPNSSTDLRAGSRVSPRCLVTLTVVIDRWMFDVMGQRIDGGCQNQAAAFDWRQTQIKLIFVMKLCSNKIA